MNVLPGFYTQAPFSAFEIIYSIVAIQQLCHGILIYVQATSGWEEDVSLGP